MKLTINKNELNKALSTVNGVIDKNAPLPSLSNILFETQDNILVLTASNGDVSVKTTTPLETNETGSVLLDGKTISDAVAKLDGDITLENKEHRVKVNNDKTEYKLNSAEVNSYPQIDFELGEDEVILDGNEFVYALEKVIGSVATSNERPIFMGVNIKSKGSELEFSSTDSYRLSKSYMTLDNEIEIDVTILGSTLRNVARIVKDKKVGFSTNGSRVVITTDDTVFVTRLVDGLYPETDRLIPNDFKSHVTVNRQDLIRAVDRASFMREDNVWTLNLSPKGDILTITTQAKEIGTTHEELPIELKGEEISLNINGKYLLDALNALEDKEVTFNLVGELQALTVSDSTNQVQLLLPMRVS